MGANGAELLVLFPVIFNNLVTNAMQGIVTYKRHAVFDCSLSAVSFLLLRKEVDEN